MYLFFEKDITSGVSYISKRNKNLKPHDSTQKSNDIIYLDVNNLYGYAMLKFLLTYRFNCIDPKGYNLNIIWTEVKDVFLLGRS